MRAPQLTPTAAAIRPPARAGAPRPATPHASWPAAPPRPKHYHALLDLAPGGAGAVEGVTLRPVRPDDWEALVPLFADAFRQAQPFAALDDATRREAAGGCLTRTRTGGDGPWIGRASF